MHTKICAVMQKYWNMEDMCGLGAAWASSIRWYISFRLHFPPSHQNVSFYPTNASTPFKIHGSQTPQNLSRLQNKWHRFREVWRISLFFAIIHDFDHTSQHWLDLKFLTRFHNLDSFSQSWPKMVTSKTSPGGWGKRKTFCCLWKSDLRCR